MDKAKELAALRVFSRVLKEIKPTPEEIKKTSEHVNRLTSSLGKIVPSGVRLHVAGSIARGTNLKGSADIDLFMLFDKKWKKEQVEKLGLRYGKELAKKLGGRHEIKYAEHPYLRIHFDSMRLRADIVPAFKIDSIEEMGTTVDRTPLHTKFINSRFSDRQRDDVRLLKCLLKAHNIYGAEARTSGFSGYLCELLVHHYGSLLKLLEAAAGFRLPLVLNPKDSSMPMDKESELRRFHSDFIVIDPVDKNRNVAAGVSYESLARLVIVAREFVSDPSEQLFKGSLGYGRKAKSIGEFLKRTGLESLLVEFRIADKSEDVVFPQLKKVSAIIAESAKRNDLTVYLIVPFVSDRRGYALILAPKTELRARLLRGPEAFIPNAPAKFLNAHRDGFGFIMSGKSILSLDTSSYPTLGALVTSIAAGSIAGNGKDIRLSSARIYANRIPGAVEEAAFSELCKKIYL